MKKNREYRSFDFELREKENEKTVEGVAIVYDTPTLMYESDSGVKFYEKISSHALEGTDMSDVIFNINHEGRPVARLRNKTLQLFNEKEGLKIKAVLSGTELGRNLYEEIEGGYIDKMSFAFTIRESSYDIDTHTRTITKIKKLYDVSAVNVPAYDETSLNARSFFEEEYSKEIRALEQAQVLKEKRELLIERINKIWKND